MVCVNVNNKNALVLLVVLARRSVRGFCAQRRRRSLFVFVLNAAGVRYSFLLLNPEGVRYSFLLLNAEGVRYSFLLPNAEGVRYSFLLPNPKAFAIRFCCSTPKAFAIRFYCSTPKAFANFSPGLAQPWEHVIKKPNQRRRCWQVVAVARQRFQRYQEFISWFSQGSANPGLKLANACGVGSTVLRHWPARISERLRRWVNRLTTLAR